MAEKTQIEKTVEIILPEPEFGIWIIDGALEKPRIQNDTEALEIETPMTGNNRIVAVFAGTGENPILRIRSKQEAIQKLLRQHSKIQDSQKFNEFKQTLNEVNDVLTEKKEKSSAVFALLEQDPETGLYNIEFITQGSCQAFIMDKDGNLTTTATTPTDKLGTKNINWVRQVISLQPGDRILLMSQQVDKRHYGEIKDALSAYPGDVETVGRVQNGLTRIFTESRPVEETMSVAVFTIPGAEPYISPEQI